MTALPQAVEVKVVSEADSSTLLPRKKRAGAQTASHTSAPRFEELDALRGFCTCIVVTGHFWFAFGDRCFIPGLVNASTMSLDVFFTMSGHVIAYSYLLDGKVKSLVSAALRRGPRLLFPALGANFLAVFFSALGFFSIHTQWRAMSENGQWCVTCFGTQVGPEMSMSWAVKSAHSLVFSFGEGSWSFPWQWTIPVELYGSFIVFMFAPFLRWIVHFQTNEEDEPGPTQLQRCVVVASVCLFGLFLAGKALEGWIRSLAPPLNPDGSVADDTFDVLASIVESKTRTAILFVAGMAMAQAHVVIQAGLQSPLSWAGKIKQKWDDMYITKWVIPLCLALLPITLPALVECVDNQNVCPQPAQWSDYIKPMVLLAGPMSVMVGVLLSPLEFRTRMGNSVFQFLGKISFSIYLMHFFVIFSIGMGLYVWLNHRFGHLATLTLIMTLCAGPLLLLSYLFWLCVEDPFGMRLPRKAVAFMWQKLDKAQHQGFTGVLHSTLRDVLSPVIGKPF